MADDAHQPLPGVPFFFAQGAAQVRQDEQFVWQASFAERTSSYAPSPGTAGKRECQWSVFVSVETNFESQIARSPAEQLVHWLPEQIFSGTVDQPQPTIGIEGEDGHVDFRHDCPEESGRFEGAESLEAKSFAQCVYFKQCLT